MEWDTHNVHNVCMSLVLTFIILVLHTLRFKYRALRVPAHWRGDV